MSDPSDDSNSYTNATNNATNNNTPAKKKSPSIYSYFTENNASKELKTEFAEMVLVFMTSTGISLYQGDDPLVAVERGAILAGGQYTGGFISDALDNSGYYTGKYKKYFPLFTKFVTATSIFVAGNKALLKSAQPYEVLIGESGVASIVAHYGGQYYKKYNKKKTVKITDVGTLYQSY